MPPSRRTRTNATAPSPGLELSLSRRPSPQRLDGRQILVFPDVDAYDYWKEKFSGHPRLQCYISDYLQRVAGPDHPSADIADYLVEYKGVLPSTLCPEPPIHPIQQILNQPEVAALIADLDLQLTSITKLNN